METFEALILRKSSYGEADLLVTLFLQGIRKIQGACQKREKRAESASGDVLDFFNRLAIDVTLNRRRFNLIGDVTSEAEATGK